jgi:hypothetical protein
MTENNEKNDLPSIDVRIDKDGVWYYKGNEMFRKEIVALFYQGLQIDNTGRYLIKNEKEAFYIDVEDVPYAVISVEFSPKDENRASFFNLLLSDESVEQLDPSTLRIGKENVLYCKVKKNIFEARFTRKSYYQLAKYIQHDPEKDTYFLSLNDRLYEISSK